MAIDMIMEQLKHVGLNISLNELQNPTFSTVCQIYGYYFDILKKSRPEEIRLQQADLLNDIFRCSTQETHAGSIPVLTFYVQLKCLFRQAQFEDFKLTDVSSPTKKRFIQQLQTFLKFYDFTNKLKVTLNDMYQKEAGQQVDIQLKEETLSANCQRLNQLKAEIQNVMPNIKTMKTSIENITRSFAQQMLSFESASNRFKEIKQKLLQTQQQNDQMLKKIQTQDEQLTAIQKRQYDQTSLDHLLLEIERIEGEITTQEKNVNEQGNELGSLDRQIAQLQRMNTELENYQEQSAQQSQLHNQVMINQQVIDQEGQEIQQIEDQIKNTKADIQRYTEQYNKYAEQLQNNNNQQENQLRQDYVERIAQKNKLVQVNLQKKSKLESILEYLNEKVTDLKERQQKHAKDATRLVDQTNELLKVWCAQAEVISRGI